MAQGYAENPINVNIETLQSLTEAIEDFTARLATLAAMANSGQPALRVIPIASVSTAVTGTVAVSAVTSVTNQVGMGGVPAYTIAVAQHNLTADIANIQNVTL